ncbi:MAG: EAL domain-containing protein [Gallionella sp.]|jgi:diguanylate cyclase (GGDEF)-like protein/PAS domain S-box-containing protein
MTILAVDDTPASLKLLTDLLKAEGYAVRAAINGELALRAARTYPPELVLLDIRMPGMDGYEVCRRLKAEPATRNVPVIFLSAASETGDKLQGFKAGAVDYVTKPFQRDELLARVHTHLELIRLRHHLEARVAARTIELSESFEALNSILETTLDGFWRTDGQGNLLDVNPAYCLLSGYTREELLGMRARDFEVEENASGLAAHLQRIVENGRDLFETRHRRKDGSIWYVEVSVTYRKIDGGQLFVFLRDISERKLAEQGLQLAASVFTYAREGILITDASGVIIDVNEAFSRITGYSREEVLGRNPRFLKSGRHENEYYAAMWTDLVGKGHWYGEIWNRRKNGEIYAEMQTISAVRDAQNEIQQYVALFSDITTLKEHENELEHIAHYDALTGLPNRVLLADRLHQGMTHALRRGQRLAVAYLDLDGFKAVNDHHGHEAGDLLLMTLADHMKQALREGDTLARLGGDEFVAVLIDLADIDSSVMLLSRLLEAAAQPVQVGSLILQVSASIGVTFFPQDGDVDADQLLRQSDQAMYQAKLAGKGRYHLFDAAQDSSIRSHHESVDGIRRALSAGEFVLYYQPKVDMRSGCVIGAEALIRWQHPEKGLLPPAVFLPVIEDHPLAVEIGEWVINTALNQVALWQEAGLRIPVSVNVGARQLQQTDFVERLRGILAAHPEVAPACLELEVLETSALQDLAHVSKVIEDCQQIGVLFALDDFGTGYSSLTYLKRLPVAQIKIDQSFVRDMLDDPDDLAILEGVISLSSAFRRQVIAEGVETLAHGEILVQLGCDLAQGYGIARPMPAGEMLAWSMNWRPESSWSSLPVASREDLPLLNASVDHRAWIKAAGDFFRGERETPPPLDIHQCRFGIWLATLGQNRYGEQPAFQSVETLHRQLHALTSELCERYTHGNAVETLARLGELHALRDALLEQISLLARGIR